MELMWADKMEARGYAKGVKALHSVILSSVRWILWLAKNFRFEEI